MLVFGELAGLGILRPCIDSIQGVFELPQETKNIKNTNLWQFLSEWTLNMGWGGNTMTPEMLIYIADDDMDNTMTPQMLLLHIPSLKLTVRTWN